MKGTPILKNHRPLMSVALAALLLPVMGGCDFFAQAEGGTEGEPSVAVQVYAESTITRTSEEKKYRPVDSFELMDGNYYYIYYLGIVDWIPLNPASASGFYYSGKEKTSHTFSLERFYETEMVDSLRSVLEMGVSLTTKTYAQESVGAKAGIFEAKLETGIENSMTTSVKETLEHSVMNASRYQETTAQSFTYDMTPGVNPAGYYLYTTVASMKVYESVVYDPVSGAISYMSPFGVLGQGLPGLVYSETSFFEPADPSLTFEEEKLGNFEKPSKKLERQTVKVDANGGSCEVSSVEVEVGRPYAALPDPARQGYIFDGWYAGDRKIEGGAEAVSFLPITAKWRPVTLQTWTINDYFVVQNGVMYDSVGGGNMDLTSCFDLIALGEQGYKMRITIEYDCKCATWSPLKQKYSIDFLVNGRSVYTYQGVLSAYQSDFEHAKQYSPLILPSAASGTMSVSITTDNILGVGFQNFKIVVEFVQ